MGSLYNIKISLINDEITIVGYPILSFHRQYHKRYDGILWFQSFHNHVRHWHQIHKKQ